MNDLNTYRIQKFKNSTLSDVSEQLNNFLIFFFFVFSENKDFIIIIMLCAIYYLNNIIVRFSKVKNVFPNPYIFFF